MKPVGIAVILLSFILSAGICGAEDAPFADQTGANKEAPKQIVPKKVQMDTNYDGKVDRIEIYDEEGNIQRVESDTNNDTIIDEWITFEKGSPAKKEKDTNADGKADVFVEY
ncbi:MAG: hypothetical protein WC779_05135 [Candidatus Omnitrophota bacterium]|jgi:hypothetical protein